MMSRCILIISLDCEMMSSTSLGSFPVREEIFFDSSEGIIFVKSIVLPSDFDTILCVITMTSFSFKDSLFSLIDFNIRLPISSPSRISSLMRIEMIYTLLNSCIMNNRFMNKRFHSCVSIVLPNFFSKRLNRIDKSLISIVVSALCLTMSTGQKPTV